MDPLAACQEFIRCNDAQEIAKQLRKDSNLCRACKRPSLLALVLPHSPSELAEKISKQLLNQDDAPQSKELPPLVRQLWYDGLVDGIKAYLSATTVTDFFKLDVDVEEPAKVPKTDHNAQLNYTPRRHPNKLCYICRFIIKEPHPLYPGMCEPCGSFNIANSLLSLPGNLDLQGMTALVTGGRVNLGFSTALRLLRCGAKVIVSSRYPRDAELRYHAESDSTIWCQRLRIVGADFRAAKDAFNLVIAVKKQLFLWTKTGRLDILINNAGQTLTDPIDTENQAVMQERILQAQSKTSICLLDDRYEPRLRGGNDSSWETSLRWHDNSLIGYRYADSEKRDNSNNEPANFDVFDSSVQHSVEQPPIQTKSSWVQSIDEIPYEDLMTAHSVNFFVPLILCRELLPVMGRQMHMNEQPDQDHQRDSGKLTQQRKHRLKGLERPHGYIINVSSREGIMEKTLHSEAKNGRHVHTNTSKAALNMITCTEASTCWRLRKVAMNTVDPGYMSAAPEMKKYGDCPITFEDGAARVLWPIAIAEREGKAIRGRFLKHYGTVEVEVETGADQ